MNAKRGPGLGGVRSWSRTRAAAAAQAPDGLGGRGDRVVVKPVAARG